MSDNRGFIVSLLHPPLQDGHSLPLWRWFSLPLPLTWYGLEKRQTDLGRCASLIVWNEDWLCLSGSPGRSEWLSEDNQKKRHSGRRADAPVHQAMALCPLLIGWANRLFFFFFVIGINFLAQRLWWLYLWIGSCWAILRSWITYEWKQQSGGCFQLLCFKLCHCLKDTSVLDVLIRNLRRDCLRWSGMDCWCAWASQKVGIFVWPGRNTPRKSKPVRKN